MAANSVIYTGYGTRTNWCCNTLYIKGKVSPIVCSNLVDPIVSLLFDLSCIGSFKICFGRDFYFQLNMWKKRSRTKENMVKMKGGKKVCNKVNNDVFASPFSPFHLVDHQRSQNATNIIQLNLKWHIHVFMGHCARNSCRGKIKKLQLIPLHNNFHWPPNSSPFFAP